MTAMTAATAVKAQGQGPWDCGEIPGTVTAALSEGTLTVSGNGKMKDYGAYETPWFQFAGYDNIIRAVVEDGITSVGKNSFSDLHDLMTVTLNNSVTAIGQSAFIRCNRLSLVLIGNQVNSIASWAFGDCDKLAFIILLNPAPPSAAVTAFDNTDKNNVCIYVPGNKIGAYIAADGWSGFSCIKDADKFSAVIFDSRGGGDTDPQMAERNGKLLRPVDPSPPVALSDRVFAGWYKDPAYSAEWDFNDGVTANMTLYAKWIKGYTVTWNAYGGAPAPTQTSVVDGGVITAPAAVTKAGYTFGGWYGDASFTAAVTFPVTDVKESKTFYAKWSGAAVTEITDVPSAVEIRKQVVLNATVLPYNATNTAIVWSVVDAGTTDAEIYNGNRLVAMSDGVIKLKATVAGGKADGTDYEQFFTVVAGSSDAVASTGRAIPRLNAAETASIVPITAPTAEFTAGPNPAGKLSGGASLFWRGARITSATLSVYDASGNVVKAVVIRDNAAVGDNGRRAVGSWDLKDRSGRSASEGVYLIKGSIKTVDGKRTAVATVVGIR